MIFSFCIQFLRPFFFDLGFPAIFSLTSQPIGHLVRWPFGHVDVGHPYLHFVHQQHFSSALLLRVHDQSTPGSCLLVVISVWGGLPNGSLFLFWEQQYSYATPNTKCFVYLFNFRVLYVVETWEREKYTNDEDEPTGTHKHKTRFNTLKRQVTS